MGKQHPPCRAIGRIKLNEMVCAGHPAQHPAWSRCFAVVFADSEFVQSLIHKMQKPGDGGSISCLGVILFNGAFTCTLRNITIIKAEAAAGPAVNTYFDLHFVEIRSI